MSKEQAQKELPSIGRIRSEWYRKLKFYISNGLIHTQGYKFAQQEYEFFHGRYVSLRKIVEGY